MVSIQSPWKTARKAATIAMAVRMAKDTVEIRTIAVANRSSS